MPSAIAPNHRAAPAEPDDLDNLFNEGNNYDDAVEDFLKDLPIPNQAANAGVEEATKDIDEEVTVKKKRKPVPKLDENRLLSQDGITKLRRITKTRLKFKGKGHEFSDMSRLLNTYQLWLDDLYPRAKFRDALQLVEKAGHSKRMQVTRRAWLDETKPHRRDASPGAMDDVEMSGALAGSGVGGFTLEDDEDAAIFGPSEPSHTMEGSRHNETPPDTAPDDDDLDALLAESRSIAVTSNALPQQTTRGPFLVDDSDDDDLDALLAENTSTATNKVASSSNGLAVPQVQKPGPLENEFEDEEEIMASMDMW